MVCSTKEKKSETAVKIIFDKVYISGFIDHQSFRSVKYFFMAWNMQIIEKRMFEMEAEEGEEENCNGRIRIENEWTNIIDVARLWMRALFSE